MNELAEIAMPDSGLPAFTSGDWGDHVETWRSLQEVEEDAKWKQAAIAASLTARWGDRTQMFAQFASEVGCSARRVYEYAATYRAFKARERSRILSFHHHTIAARDPDPEHAIDEAEIEELSTREMAPKVSERIRASRGDGDSEPGMKTCPTCDGKGKVEVEEW